MAQDTHRRGSGSAAGSTRERARVRREAARRAERRRRLLTVGGAIVGVIAVVVAFVVAKLTTGGAVGADTTAAAPTAVTAPVAAVPAATLSAIGAGSSNNPLTPVTGSPLTSGGHPQILYVGADYCPFCAAERWPLAVALSRFGTLSGLQTTTSAGNDSYPNTATLSFANATYTSDFLSFAAVEEQDRNGKPLQTPTAAQQALVVQYDNVRGQHPIPFIDLGNTFTSSGAQYDPAVLAGLSAAQIADRLADPASKVAKAVDGSANVLTASMCVLTGNKPVGVCDNAGVTAATARLHGGGSGAGQSSH